MASIEEEDVLGLEFTISKDDNHDSDHLQGSPPLEKPVDEDVNDEEDDEDDEEDFEYNVDEVVAKLKEKLKHMFLNEQVAEDIPLRLKMQNHGGWIPFAFLEAYDKHMKLFPEPKLWERAVAELPELFEIKDVKFRRREMLPDLEKKINDESILLLFERNDIAYADVNPMMRALRKQKEIYKGSVYRLFNAGHSNCPRDVTRLLQQCPILRQRTFVWYQVKKPQAALEYFQNFERSPGLAFAAVALNDFLNEHRLAPAPRQRGITVCVGGEELSRNLARNAQKGKTSEGFSSPRKNGTVKCDWSTVRQTSISKLPGASATVSETNTSGNNTPAECLVETNAVKGRGMGQSWRPRRRLAQSESDSGALNSPLLRPLFVHAIDGERPHFVTKSNTSGASGNDPTRVKLARQPRAPSKDFGFDLDKLLTEFTFYN